MNRLSQIVLLVSGAVLLGGCFTVHHSPYPEVAMSSAPQGRDVRVQVSGFEALVTSYLPIYGQETVWRSGHYYGRGGRRYHGGMTAETYTTTTYIPQTSQTTAFVEQAQHRLEDAGFIVGGTNATYRIDVHFSGPVTTGGERASEFFCLLLSAFTADYSAQSWSARLGIYDVASGRLLMHNDYTERCSAAVWGPIPLISPAAADETDSQVMQSWCLSALTDRVMADATAFLSAQTK